MAITTTSTLQYNLHSYYVKKLLETLQPRLALYELGKKTDLPKGTGKLAKWLIYTKIASSSAALTEGASGTEISSVSANVEATIAQYGQFIKLSDLLSFTAIDPVIQSHAQLFGEAAAESIEDLIVAELDGSLTTRRVNGRASSDNNIVAGDVCTLKEFLKAKVALQASYVKPHESGSFVAVLHPHSEYDLLSEANPMGWLSASMYNPNMQKGLLSGEIGRIMGIRFMVSDKMTSAANTGSVSVKKNYLLGGECFGVVQIGGSRKSGVEIISHAAGSGGVADPLNMYSTVGYKFQMVVKNFAAARGIQLRGATSFA